jgi:nicotinamidase-related amidase
MGSTSSATVSNKCTLLIIDAQNDFHSNGSLAVKGADEDAEKIAQFIRKSMEPGSSIELDRIVATLDSHHLLHIANPQFWVASDNVTHPEPFTLITSEDVKNGKWSPRSDLRISTNLVDANVMKNCSDLFQSDGSLDLKKYCIEYTRRLEESSRLTLCIWPPHCLIGSRGHNVVDVVRDAMDEWTSKTGRSVDYIMKGTNLLTEMYSALKAEVVISKDTDLNQDLLSLLKQSDKIFVCGQALSHCVNHTVRDLLANMKGSENKVCLLSDCCSPVTSFEKDAQDFVRFLQENGANVEKSNAIH